MVVHPGGLAAIAQGAYKARYGKADAALLEDLRERCGGEVTKGALLARHGAAEFQLRFLPQQQHYVVSVACPLAGRFRVTRKGALGRWMQAFVPALEFRSHDSRFDRDFSVQTRDLEVASAVLTKQPNRAVVRRLFDRGAQAVVLHGDRVEVSGGRKALGARPLAEAILELVEELTRLAEVVTDFAARHEVRPSPKNDAAVVASWTSLGALGVLGFAMLIAGAIEYTLVQPAPFLLPCAIFGLPAAVLVVFALALAVQRRTSPYALVLGLSLLALIVVPLFVSGGLLLSNGILDNAPAEELEVSVIGKSVRKNKNERNYYAGLASWWADDDVRWVRVSRATFDKLEPHVSQMQIRTHPGKLGYEWFDDYSLLP